MFFEHFLLGEGLGRSMRFALYTVDGRNPAPVDMANMALCARFYTSQVVIAGFLNHQLHDVCIEHFSKMVSPHF